MTNQATEEKKKRILEAVAGIGANPVLNAEEKAQELVQTVLIEFSDGTRGVFTGRVAANPGDNKTISKITFTAPRPLPERVSFQILS